MRVRAPVSLNVIRAANQCPVDWNTMHGDDRVRFCDQCRLHVYNLSELTRTQAKNLVAEHDGRLCVRYYQRADGTVITHDCGGGLRRAIKRTRRLVTTLAGAIVCALLTPPGFASLSRSLKPDLPERDSQECQVQGKMTVMGDVAPVPRPPVMMGIVAPRPPATQPTTQPTENPTTRPADDRRGE